MDEGPTKGTTCISFSCAILTTSAPGSAIPGQPASDNKPTGLPLRQPSRKLGKSLSSVYLFKI